jgi:hypothetical protein
MKETTLGAEGWERRVVLLAVETDQMVASRTNPLVASRTTLLVV